MKTYEITLKHDNGTVNLRAQAESIEAAKRIVLTAEGAPENAVQTWRVVPTARQIRRTQNLMRNL